MSKKLKRILAIVALVFVGLFTVSFILFLFFPKVLNGSLSYASLLFGGVGLILFFVVKFTKVQGEEPDEIIPAPQDDDADKGNAEVQNEDSVQSSENASSANDAEASKTQKSDIVSVQAEKIDLSSEKADKKTKQG